MSSKFKTSLFLLSAAALLSYSLPSFSQGAAESQIPGLKKYELPKEVLGEGKVKTKIEPAGYSLSDTNKYKIGDVIDSYEMIMVTNRNSLVYYSKGNEIRDGNVYFSILTIFSKLDSTEVTEGIPAETFDQPEPVYSILKLSGDCVNKKLNYRSSSYYDKQSKLIGWLSTEIPQEGETPNSKNINGIILKMACEEHEKIKNSPEEKLKPKREVTITPQGQTLIKK